MYGLAPLLLLLPFIGFLINGLFGRRFVEADANSGERWTGWIAAGMSLATFVVTLGIFSTIITETNHVEIVTLWEWINVPGPDGSAFRIPWAMHLDTLSVSMLMVVTGVGSLIHIYAIGYMHGDKDFSRFFAYLNLFLFFMIMLVVGSSYLMLFVGWEGVGLASFLLIGFWFDKEELDEEGVSLGFRNGGAARKAMIANRVGDFAMILAMILMFWTFGSMEFTTVFDSAVDIFEHSNEVTLLGTDITRPLPQILSWITALLLMGAAGKSAQLPLFIWLPDAMAGPTPVSALMHAATMVTSGIYLLVRSNVLLEIVRESGWLLWGFISSPDLIALVGAGTALYAGLIAFTQFDIKKVLAYSTVSQLGFMIAAVGMGAYVAGMFHLITHAFFKALLFMGAGSVIHGVEHGHHELHDGHHGHDHDENVVYAAGHEHAHAAHGEHDSAHAAENHGGGHDDGFDPQDMRFMGGLRHKMPWTFRVYMIGALALAGIFPFAGFWSKDEILAHASANSTPVNTAIYAILSIAAFCTAFYMGRQLRMVFFDEPRHEASEHAHESAPVMIRPLMVLAVLSVIGGILINMPNLPFGGGGSSYDDGHSTMVEPARLGKTLAAEGYNSAKWETLWLEHWLEPSIESFHLTDEGIVHMPHTPTTLSLTVAGISTVLAVSALALSFFVVYAGKWDSAEDRDPLQSTPIWLAATKPLDTFVMKGFLPAFDRFAKFCGITIDWEFYHNFVHERLIRDTFVMWSDWYANQIDRGVLDRGIVLGAGRLVRGMSDVLRQAQTGYVRNYALMLFLGVVGVVAYFIFA